MKYLSFFLLFLTNFALAQVSLDADGPGNTYELINSVLAPGFDAVEEPDCNHASFGRHIDEIFDTDLNTNVFRFHIHTNEDNDRCINLDRQRNEIKTYDKSPDNLKGTDGESVQYKWKFKIASGFQPSSSFTHIHQLKAVGGTESSMPSITLTLRKASPNQLELRYAETTSQVTLAQVDLAPFEGEWVEVTQTVLYGEMGMYEITIDKVSDGTNLLTYSDYSIRMWKTDADFIRPKWGIYRSLNNIIDLRDEEVLFANFSITELPSFPVEISRFESSVIEKNKIELQWTTASELNNDYFEIERSTDGNIFKDIGRVKGNGTSSLVERYSFIDDSPHFGKNYYRLKQVDFDGVFSFSKILLENIQTDKSEISIFPNPSKDFICIESHVNIEQVRVYNIVGENLSHTAVINKKNDQTYNLNLQGLETGLYIISVKTNDNNDSSKIILKE